MSLVPRITVKVVAMHIDGDHSRTVVTLHGWPDTFGLWNTTGAVLKECYCCVRFTLSGVDLAAPPRMTSLDDMCILLHAVVEQVSPGVSVTLLLHDWDCIFGHEFAARFPDRVTRVIAIGTGDPNPDAMVWALTPGQRAQLFATNFGSR